MEVKDAVKIAVNYVADVFSGENAKNIGLEEIKFDEFKRVWEVTIGFSRPWDYQQQDSGIHSALTVLRPRNNTVRDFISTLQTKNSQKESKQPQRQYKIVEVSDKDGKVKSLRIRNG